MFYFYSPTCIFASWGDSFQIRLTEIKHLTLRIQLPLCPSDSSWTFCRRFLNLARHRLQSTWSWINQWASMLVILDPWARHLALRAWSGLSCLTLYVIPQHLQPLSLSSFFQELGWADILLFWTLWQWFSPVLITSDFEINNLSDYIPSYTRDSVHRQRLSVQFKFSEYVLRLTNVVGHVSTRKTVMTIFIFLTLVQITMTRNQLDRYRASFPVSICNEFYARACSDQIVT